MNRLTKVSAFPFPDMETFGRNLVPRESIFDGMGRFFDDVKFPKYNILWKGKDMEIEVALAGYAKDDINIELTPENVLIVSSDGKDVKPAEDEDVADEHEYVHRGVAARNFSIEWKILSSEVEVGSITYVDGMLRIPLINTTPPKPDTKFLKIK